jgi:hypothetical protein
MGDQDSAASHISETHTNPKPYLSSCPLDLSFSLEDILSTLQSNVSMGYIPLLVRSCDRSRMESHWLISLVFWFIDLMWFPIFVC